MNVTKKIAERFVDEKADSIELKAAIAQLRAGMTKEQRKQLLFILDEYEEKVYDAMYDNFERGFCLGVRLGREVFSRRGKDYL